MRLNEIKISLPKVSNNFVDNICLEFLKGKTKPNLVWMHILVIPNNQKVEIGGLQ